MFYDIAANWNTYTLATPLNSQVLVHEGSELVIQVPECSLASDALQIIPKRRAANFTDWTFEMQQEAFYLMQKIALLWKQKGITDFLIYGKETGGNVFSFEMVPYEKSPFSFFRQLKVLFGITFGAYADTKEKREAVAREYEGVRDFFSEKLSNLSLRVEEMISHDDVFCKESTHEKQCVFKGRTISVLQDYAPLATGEEKLHLILVTNAHRDSFSNMHEEEYLESAGIASRLIAHYRAKGFYTVYVFEKIGRPAGQSVRHRHLHLVFTRFQSEELLGKLLVLKKMVLGTSKMKDDELAERVEALRRELLPVLQDTI